jgi:hypothetical protein
MDVTFTMRFSCCLFIVLGTSAAADTMDRHNFPAGSPAKCTDGTPAAYYTQLNASSPNWVLWIEGGGVCESYDDCVGRQKGSLGSSKYFDKSHAASQLISNDPAENPDFASWNHVWIPYCSGDVWLGQTTNPLNPWSEGDDDTFQDMRHLGGSLSLPTSLALKLYNQSSKRSGNGAKKDTQFQFAGHTIIAETVAALQAKHNLGKPSENGDKPSVILTGCSAGGIGTFHNTEWLAATLPDARVVGNPQAGYFGLPEMDYAHFSKGLPETGKLLKNFGFLALASIPNTWLIT